MLGGLSFALRFLVRGRFRLTLCKPLVVDDQEGITDNGVPTFIILGNLLLFRTEYMPTATVGSGRMPRS
jgi:hypothetical protein